ncbi:hypothetical protein V5F29_02625 [Xanthobacter aminoxidans]|jgi:hypothetical protein|uniref:hypothetical protein n=1 Tax=Xanthobacter TaxID=279 RepID=UPI00045E6B71|nr:hypothetical protein [Xanthobacter sp. 126]
MLKIAILVWLVLATTFAGAAVLAVLSIPSLAGQDMRLIPIAAGAGAVVAIPFALIIAKRILALTATKA